MNDFEKRKKIIEDREKEALSCCKGLVGKIHEIHKSKRKLLDYRENTHQYHTTEKSKWAKLYSETEKILHLPFVTNMLEESNLIILYITDQIQDEIKKFSITYKEKEVLNIHYPLDAMPGGWRSPYTKINTFFPGSWETQTKKTLGKIKTEYGQRLVNVEKEECAQKKRENEIRMNGMLSEREKNLGLS